ncbi:hypothetical protein ACFL6N_05470 [Thermodesulfobacteriota bacterium]
MNHPLIGQTKEHKDAHEQGKYQGDKKHVHAGEEWAISLVAAPDNKGEYDQPVIDMPGRKFFYRALYAATVENGRISFTKTTASSDSPNRSPAEVEEFILREVAEQVGGTVAGQSVLLP